MTKKVDQKPDYGNWVSKRLIYSFSLLTALFAALHLYVWLLIPAFIFLDIAIYFAYARHLFSPKGANIQHKIWG
jgi:hypothetical protein